MKNRLKFSKKLKRQEKKLLSFLVSLLVIFIALSPASRGTLAVMFKSLGPFSNIFTIGKANIDIVEPNVPDPDDVAWGENNKIVSVSVPSDSIPGVVRVFILPMLKTDSGEFIAGQLGELTDPGAAGEIVLGEITLHFASDWSDYWFFKDGYFFCKTVVQPGTSVAHLLTGITLTNDTPEMREKYQSITVEIEVFAEIIQSTSGAPNEWGVTVTGANVTAL